ncbi:G-box binding factor 2 [Actinidia rufa]|uniref:G-box binding factor 2 n=1 Tax=Actinidia rufa TaxID=165716 RepID=A0A7J0DN92_9ERIC|nr:G-box binding factor 2 [Actinidia rufa]
MMLGYQSGPRNMAGLAAYSLTHQSTHMSMRRVAVCPVTRQLARQAELLYHIKSAFISLKSHSQGVWPPHVYVIKFFSLSTGGENGNTKSKKSPVPAGEVNGGSDKVMVVNTGATKALELRNPPDANANATQPSAMIPNEAWLQNDRELKRERRKQSNRESARRSRLRKQAEAEELAIKVDALSAENTTLKTEISRLKENSEKLKLENTTLMEKLKNAQGGLTEEVILTKLDDKRVPVSTENLLSRVNNSGSVDRSDEGSQSYENNSNSGVKLRQLLGARSRADAVAAG